MSLRIRVVCLIGVVLLLSMALGTFVAAVQTRAVLRAELGSGLSGAQQTVRSAYEDLPKSDHQGRDLHQLVATFDGNRHVQAALLNADGRSIQISRGAASFARSPPWFQRLLGSAPSAVALHVPEGVRGYSAIVLSPTAAIDVGDAWAQFSGVAAVMVFSAAVGLSLVYFVIGAAFQPLVGLADGFERIGTGDFSGRLEEKGPPELLRLQQGFNRMAGQLAGTTDRNRQLTDQLLTIQDEERADIARDLHDEIGPHLFAVNMDAEMIIQLQDAGRHDAVTGQVRAIQKGVAHMQRQVRELLGRLRPARVTEFGLNAAIEELAAFWASRRPDITFEIDLVAEEDLLTETLKEAAYRIVQEASNNAVRHAKPRSIQVRLEMQNGRDLAVTVFDDGAEGSNRPDGGGLGLVGMRERVSALGGSLLFGRTVGGVGWRVVARLPMRPPLYADQRTRAKA